MSNAADESGVKAQAESEERRAQRDLDGLRYVLATKDGRRFLWNLVTECGVFVCSFDGSSRTFFREGERNVGLKIIARLNAADPNWYGTMVKESQGGDYV